MKDCTHIVSILIALHDNRVSKVQINLLIETAQSYAYTYLKYRYKNLNKLFLSEDLTLQELAIDSIAQIFERDDEGKFIKLIDAFDNWQPPIETEEAALFFLNRMAGKSVEKYVSELLRDSDPFFSKILDSITYYIEKNAYKKKQILGTTYIVENDSKLKIGCLPDGQLLADIPSELFQDVSTILPKLFEYIKTNTSYEVAIPLNVLVMRIKKLKTSLVYFSEKVEVSKDIIIESILDSAFNSTMEKLRESYTQTGKLSAEESCGIEKAIHSIILDMRDGGINPGLHKYFLEQFPKLTPRDYETKYQNVFEYLYKFLRKEIAVQIKDGI